MKPTFHHGLVNGPFDDPSLYVRLLWQRRALLFDAGDISALDRGSILKISDVFVTHTHIDHFIGFDILLRTHLRSEHTLRVYGPPGITEQIEGKLGGYSWNLIEQYPLKLEVADIGGGMMRRASFQASESFGRRDGESKEFSGFVLEEEAFRVRAAVLRHDIPCLAYSMEEEYHMNIDKDALEKMGLPVGPWLSELKRLVRQGADDETELEAGGGRYRLGELRSLTMKTRGQKIAYVMDAEPDEDNVAKIIDLARDADTLYCEAYFMDADRDRALQRHHLTARLAGKIAREAGVRELVVTHFSPKYMSSGESPEREALDEFLRGS